MNLLLRGLVCMLAAAALAAAALRWAAPAAPDIEIRTRPWATQFGHVWPAYAPGQRFVCEREGLARIDVAYVPIGARTASAVELVLRIDGVLPDSEPLRRARAISLLAPDERGWLSFEFEPVPDSAGRAFHFELVPVDGQNPSILAPWMRFRGHSIIGRPWGDLILPGLVHESEFRCLAPDLRGMAFAMNGVDAAAGPAWLEIWDADAPPDAPPKVRAPLRPSAPLAAGWALFGFDPLPESRWHEYRYRLSLPAGARPVGTLEGPSYITFHGGGVVDPRLLGMSVGRGADSRLDDRDLVFRAWSKATLESEWQRLDERSGGRMPVVALVWLAAAGLLGALVGHTDPRSPQRPSESARVAAGEPRT